MLGECFTSGCDSSLNILVLIYVFGAVYMSHVDVTSNILDLSVVDICWCVGLRHQLCLRVVNLQILFVTFIS